MNKRLLIVGAGVYGTVAAEIATEMGCFETIDFVDDEKEITPTGIRVVGTTRDLKQLLLHYEHIVVAVGNSDFRCSLLQWIREETLYHVVSLISPRAYVSPTAKIEAGCVVEPMATIHTGCTIEEGCIISAGAVVNHASKCCKGVHIDCNATVPGYMLVPPKTKVPCGKIFESNEQAKTSN